MFASGLGAARDDELRGIPGRTRRTIIRKRDGRRAPRKPLLLLYILGQVAQQDSLYNDRSPPASSLARYGRLVDPTIRSAARAATGCGKPPGPVLYLSGGSGCPGGKPCGGMIKRPHEKRLWQGFPLSGKAAALIRHGPEKLGRAAVSQRTSKGAPLRPRPRPPGRLGDPRQPFPLLTPRRNPQRRRDGKRGGSVGAPPGRNRVPATSAAAGFRFRLSASNGPAGRASCRREPVAEAGKARGRLAGATTLRSVPTWRARSGRTCTDS